MQCAPSVSPTNYEFSGKHVCNGVFNFFPDLSKEESDDVRFKQVLNTQEPYTYLSDVILLPHIL